MSADISRLTAKGDCSLKCAYDFYYHASNSSVRNDSSSITISYDRSVFSPVSFNELKYYVSYIKIVQPSMHTYNGVRADAEILIIHQQEDSEYFLIVCIPIVSSNNYTKAGRVITDIINKTPKSGSSNLDNEFTLQDIVPNSPFISYNFSVMNAVAFELDYAIPVSVDTINKLKSVISAGPKESIIVKDTYFNKNGPNRSGKDDDIYISCQPTGASGETIQTEQEKAKSSVQFDFSTIMNNPWILGFMVMFLFIIFLFIVNAVYGYIFVGKTNKPESSSDGKGEKGTTSAKGATKGGKRVGYKNRL